MNKLCNSEAFTKHRSFSITNKMKFIRNIEIIGDIVHFEKQKHYFCAKFKKKNNNVRN